MTIQRLSHIAWNVAALVLAGLMLVSPALLMGLALAGKFHLIDLFLCWFVGFRYKRTILFVKDTWYDLKLQFRKVES